MYDELKSIMAFAKEKFGAFKLELGNGSSILISEEMLVKILVEYFRWRRE